MYRKFLTVIILVILCVLMVACNQSTGGNKTSNETSGVDAVEKDKKPMDVRIDENGIEFNFPDKWMESNGRNINMYTQKAEENILGQIIVSYILDETIDKAEKISQEADKIPGTDKEAIQKASEELRELLNEFKDLCRIVTIDKSITEGKAQKELFSKYDNKYLLGKEDNFEFYLLYNNKPNVDGLSEMSKKAYEEYHGEIESLKTLINIYNPVSEVEKVGKFKLEFKTKTLDGREIDSSILKTSKLTMINVWATYCQPCIEEMPDLQSLYEEVRTDGVNIIGIVSDTPDEDNEELARRIVSTKGVEYMNIIPDESLIKNVLHNIAAVPTTLFIDGEGNIIGDLVVGARSKEKYKKEIEDRLEIINK